MGFAGHTDTGLIDAFELLAGSRVGLGGHQSASFSGLVHPVHREGGAFWVGGAELDWA